MPKKIKKLLKIAILTLIFSLMKLLQAINLTFVDTMNVILLGYENVATRYKYFSWWEHLKMGFLLKMADF